MTSDKDSKPKQPRTVEGWYVTEENFPSDPIGRLIYYARLAPSSHNSQPWKFVTGSSEIDLFADHDRWLRVADGDQRELHISLGCALETLRIAADFGGWGTRVEYFPTAGSETLVARLHVIFAGLKRENAAADLLRHMVTRHTSHRLFDTAKPISDADRKRLYQCFEIGDVSLHFLNDRLALDSLVAVETRADDALLGRPGYRAELARSIGEGMLGTTWLLSKLGQLAVGHLPVAGQGKHSDSERLASAPLVALLTTRQDRRVDQLNAGEAFMRIALAAEARDIRVQPVSQVLEVPETRAEVARIFDLGDRVSQHLFRLGHAEAEPRRFARRPIGEVHVRSG
jgi:nitroreductase